MTRLNYRFNKPAFGYVGSMPKAWMFTPRLKSNLYPVYWGIRLGAGGGSNG